MSAPSSRDWIVGALSRYWPRDPSPIRALPIREAGAVFGSLADLVDVTLPEWAGDCGVEGKLLVPAFARAEPRDSVEPWRAVDWLGAASWFLAGAAEREHEAREGPVHSYSYRLGRLEPRAFEFAWVNRAALFLRRWAAREANREETDFFGPRPSAEIVVTHDVDAIEKTFAIRFKQSLFRGFRAARLALRRELTLARDVGASAASFAFGPGTFDLLDDVAEADERAGRRGTFHIHARRAWRSPTDALLDPGYRLDSDLGGRLRAIAERGHTIGAHPSYSAWNDAARLREEREAVSRAAAVEARACRQHWLRFSWEKTWTAQEQAGFSVDSTLAFNDRPGFRVSAALRHHPWNPGRATAHEIQVLPLVVMDSHLYDYAELDPGARTSRLRHFIDEIRAVGGEAAFLWHPHTLSQDYGWRSGFEEMLDLLGPTR